MARFFIQVLLLVCCALAPAGVVVAQTHIYVANSWSDDVSVIDAATNTVITTISVGSAPSALVGTPDGTRVYVSNQAGASVSVIDTALNTVVDTIQMTGSNLNTINLAMSPAGDLVYVVHANVGRVTAIDTSTNSIIAEIEVGDNPTHLVFLPDGAFVLVTNLLSHSVSMIDTSTHSVVKEISVGRLPSGVAVTSNGALAYVANWSSRTVTVIDVASQAVVHTILGIRGAWDVGVTPNDQSVYVVQFSTPPGLTEIDPFTNTIVDSVSVPAWQSSIVFSDDGSRAYVNDFCCEDNVVLGDSIFVIDTATNTILDEIVVGTAPSGMALVTPPTPEAAIEALTLEVAALVGEPLNAGAANSLTAKLDAALISLGTGNDIAAMNQLLAFTNQVQALINSGKLTPDQGGLLINAANGLVDQILGGG